MRTIRLTALATMVILTAAGAFAQGGQGWGGGGKGDCAKLDGLPAGTLSEAEKAGLLFTREEEKLARDVYTALYETWEAPIFLHIAGSEQRHMDAVKALLDRYALTDPVGANPAGVFTDAALQELYDDLVLKGKLTPVDGLAVGATIEDLDLRDVMKLVDESDNVDLDTVYSNLARGSRNHLRAFVGELTALGATYTPQYIDAALYEQIVSTPRERGPVDANGKPVGGGPGCGGCGGQGQGGSGHGTCDGAGQGSGQGSGGQNGTGSGSGSGNGKP